MNNETLIYFLGIQYLMSSNYFKKSSIGKYLIGVRYHLKKYLDENLNIDRIIGLMEAHYKIRYMEYYQISLIEKSG